MKKNVVKFGLIAGLITSVWVMILPAVEEHANFENGYLYGYTAMILAFSFIFVAVKSYRDKDNAGYVTFGKAFRIGLYITLIASSFYVITWLIEYYFFVPDFMDKYTSHMLENMKASGASQAEIDEQMAEMAKFKEWYKNPFFNALITYMEILPVGLVISLISAAILKRNPAVLSPVEVRS